MVVLNTAFAQIVGLCGLELTTNAPVLNSIFFTLQLSDHIYVLWVVPINDALNITIDNAHRTRGRFFYNLGHNARRGRWLFHDTHRPRHCDFLDDFLYARRLVALCA